MNGRFGHPGALGFMAEAERLLPGPHRHIQLLTRQAVLLSRLIPPRSIQLLTDEEIGTLRRRTGGVPRSFSRKVTTDALRNQGQIILLLGDLHKVAGTRLTTDDIRVIITERAALYADYWEFALREWTCLTSDDFNRIAVANVLGMTKSELHAHLKTVSLKCDAERSARAALDAERSMAARHHVLRVHGVEEPGKNPVRDSVTLALVQGDVPQARAIAHSAATLVGT
jgi:hypothetical protein